jgi:Tfp pilus assembly protein PilN
MLTEVNAPHIYRMNRRAKRRRWGAQVSLMAGLLILVLGAVLLITGRTARTIQLQQHEINQLRQELEETRGQLDMERQRAEVYYKHIITRGPEHGYNQVLLPLYNMVMEKQNMDQ